MTKAIILAAGQGTRLKPFTDFIPKTMVPLKGRPIIEYQMDCFQNNGISEMCPDLFRFNNHFIYIR